MKYLLIGKFGSPFQLKGELFFHVDGSFDVLKSDFLLFIKLQDLDQSYSSIFNYTFRAEKSSEFFQLPQFSYRILKKKYVVHFTNFNQIDFILPLVNVSVYFLKDHLKNLTSSDYYHHQLIGAKVYLSNDYLALLKSIRNFGAGNLCELEIPEESLFNKSKKIRSIFLPFSENYIQDIDINNKIIIFKKFSLEEFF